MYEFGDKASLLPSSLPPRPMDNACFQDDTPVEMKSVKHQEDLRIPLAMKEKISFNFENISYSKVELPATDVNNEIKTEQDLQQFIGACVPQLCQETSKNVLKIARINKIFDPLIKLKLKVEVPPTYENNEMKTKEDPQQCVGAGEPSLGTRNDEVLDPIHKFKIRLFFFTLLLFVLWIIIHFSVMNS